MLQRTSKEKNTYNKIISSERESAELNRSDVEDEISFVYFEINLCKK
jgi:hypothetical protein